MSSRRPNRARTSRSGEDGAIPRITPRNSDVEAADTAETPYGTLRQLANIPRPSTPLRRASSVGPPSIHRSSRRTPAAQARTPGAAHRYGGSGKKASVLTPHGRAAAREIEARRAGLTPGKDRRRSGRQQRETPRDALRLLSRALAPKTQPVVPTPQAEVPISRRNNLPPDDDLDEDELAPPRLSMALDNDEDDSLLLPPQSAGLEDDNFTVQSVEMGRRAISEQPGGRFSRGSFGSIRMSDQFGNLDMGMDGTMAGIDSSLVRDNAFEDSDAPDMTEIRSILGEGTETLRNMNLAAHQFNAPGRDSDIRPAHLPGDESEATFVFTVPQDALEGQEVGPLVDAEDDGDQYEHMDISDGLEQPYPDMEGQEPLERFEKAGAESQKRREELPALSPRRAGIPRRKKVRLSKHGVPYHPLPNLVVKKLATTFARTSVNAKAKISREALDAIMQASDWFFEQISDDLGAYAKHGGRRTIEESDAVALMKRQRQTNATTTAFSLAQRYLPRELLQELRMVPPTKVKQRARLAIIDEGDEDMD